MARRREAPYHLRSKNGRAYVDYSTPEGRRKAYLGIPYDPDRSGPAERRAAEQAAEAKWRALTDGRTLERGGRVLTDLNLAELYAIYLRQWEPKPSDDENTRRRQATSLVVRRTYGTTLTEWATDMSSPRWRDDKRTPLERVVDDESPGNFLAWRLLSVQRKTMRKEKSNLVQFLGWAKASGYLASIPAIDLPSGGGTPHPSVKKSGRGVDIPLTPLQAAQIVEAMPEWSSRTARNGGERFLVRPFFELMRLTGLREATLERLEVPRNWRPKATALRLDDADDKAKYGRALPLIPDAIALLTKYAPTSGHIFGHHDYRKHVKRAAAVVFADQPDLAERFGGYHFRHFVGTFLANRAGTNLAAASYVLGHTNLGTTSIYVHADETAARELLEATGAEMRKAGKAAAAWGRKLRRKAGAENSGPILSPKPPADSSSDR